MATFLSGLKDGLTLVKEQDGVVDLGLAEYELEVLPRSHASKGGKIYQQNLYPIGGEGGEGGEGC